MTRESGFCVSLEDWNSHDSVNVKAIPGQPIVFSTCCDAVAVADRRQVAQLRDALTWWLAMGEDE